MTINQRDVIEVNFLFPDGKIKPHLAVVLSIPEVINCEQTFIGVPISSATQWINNEFSFPVDNSDFNKQLKYPADSYVRMHLITVIPTSSIIQGGFSMVMKPAAFNRLLDQIQELVFGMPDA